MFGDCPNCDNGGVGAPPCYCTPHERARAREIIRRQEAKRRRELGIETTIERYEREVREGKA